jgi:hypothetical protein
MQLSIRNAAGRVESIEKATVAGRTVLRLKHGERLEIVDATTGATPAGVKARRGGADGNDLIIEGFGESVLIEGFFEKTAQGETPVAVEFPGGAAPEITPATPELAMPGAVLDTGFAGESAGYVSMAQTSGAVVSSAGSSASAAASTGVASTASSALSNAWWIAGGVAGAGAAGAAIEHNTSNGNKAEAPPAPPAPKPATFELVRSAASVDEGDNVTFTLNTTNVAPGTQYTYTISGISADDVQGGVLAGTVTVDANGRAVIQITLAADRTTEGVENLTVSVAGQSASVEINDVSLTPAFVLTEGHDNVTGTIGDDTIIGSHLTYNTGDVIDGGAGRDQLNLTLQGGTSVDGVTVSNVEQVNLRTTEGNGGVELSMTGFDGRVSQINVESARADLAIVDQQSLAAVSITDVSGSTIFLDYDSQVVSGEADELKLAIDEFVGTLAVDENIEAIDLRVDDGVDEGSELQLVAGGVTRVTVSGGIAGQAAAFDVAINEDRIAGASFDATGFAGNVVLNGVGGSEISDLRLGAGDDTVVVDDNGGDISYGDSFDLGDGNDTLTVGHDVHGTVRFGTGNNAMSVGEDVGASAQVSFGAGDSVLNVDRDIEADASVSFLSGNNTVRAASVVDSASIVFNGDGDNLLDLETEFYSFMPQSDYGRIGGSASVSFNGAGNNRLIAGEILDDAAVTFGDGDNTAETDDIEGNASVTFGDGDSSLQVRGEDGDISGNATVSFGGGDNQLSVGGDIRDGGKVTFGDGDNEAGVRGSIRHASLEFGDGNNELSVGGEMQSATVSFGAGDNTVRVETNLHFSTLQFGDGDNKVRVDEELRATSVEFGAGDDAMFIGTAVRDGSQLDFGAGNDALKLGDGGEGRVHVHGGEDATVIDMGDGDDTVTITGSDDEETDTLVRSGGFLRGGEGNDTLTVQAVDTIEALVARTQAQRVTLTFDGNYALDQIVSVSINGVDYSYTVRSSDIVQGDALGTRENVASGLKAVIQQDQNAALTVAAGATDDSFILEGTIGAADVAVAAEGLTSEVTCIADAGISGFETLNLIALNPVKDEDDNDDANDDDNTAADITADFSLISGVQQINLSSEVTLRSRQELEEGVVNGTYTRNHAGDPVTFTLLNLPAGLGEHITVSGNEVTATGNRQVERFQIGAEPGDHQIGDVITIEIDAVKYSVTVTADDLSGATAQEDADNIAARLAQVVAAGETGFTVAVDGSVITLIGNSGDDVDVGFDSDSASDGHEQMQSATPVDDQDIDVSVNAVLAEEADTDNDTLALTIKGTGDFDLGIDGAWDGFTVFTPQPMIAYENLSITVQDNFSHYIDTDENDDNREFVRGSIALAGGIAGASIVIDDVMARSVTSSSAANVKVVFDSHADQGEHYDFSVSTLGGADVVDMKGVILSSLSTVDLGEGRDRLIIGNGREAADDVTSGSAPTDEGRMFRHVSNVEELEFHGEDAITFDDDAFESGFDKLIVGADSNLLFRVGDEFARDLTVDIADDVRISMEIYNDHDITVTAQDRLDATVRLASGSSGDFTLTAADEAEVELKSNGTGAVSVAVAAGSEVGISFGENSVSAADVTVTQSSSDSNAIKFEELTQAQNVVVDITMYGHGEDTTVADRNGDLQAYDTNLEVDEGSAGIDKLVLRTDEDRGASYDVIAVIDDSWAVSDGNASSFDLTVDATEVSATHVFLNGSLETEASLQLLGSKSSENMLMGGAAGDSLKGGDQSDVLLGDRYHDDELFAASDTLEGGGGRDYYAISESQFDTMDTIVGLDLGAGAPGTSDYLMLGMYAEAEAYDGPGSDWTSYFEMDRLLQIDTVVNDGSAVDIEGLDLQAAVNSLFQANGVFEQSGPAATHAAGLFNWGNDTYLIALGDQAGSGFGSDDYIVKVTGVAGTLDVSDFFQPA